MDLPTVEEELLGLDHDVKLDRLVVLNELDCEVPELSELAVLELDGLEADVVEASEL